MGASRHEQLRLANLGATLRLPDFTWWVAAHADRYHLGSTSAAARRAYDALVARLDATPLTLPDGTEVNGNVVRIMTYEGLYRNAGFPGLAETWQLLISATTSGRAPVALSASPTPHPAVHPEVPLDNVPSVQAAIHCNDEPWPRDLDTYRRAVALDRRLFPAFAGFAGNVWACAFWRLPQREPAVRVGPIGNRNVLIAQNLRDPATPWIGGAGMRRALGTDAALLTVDQGGHTAYLVTPSACASETVTAFLARGVLPAAPLTCPGRAVA